MTILKERGRMEKIKCWCSNKSDKRCRPLWLSGGDNSSYQSYQRFSQINEAKCSFSIELTSWPRLHVAVNKERLVRGRNCEKSYCPALLSGMKSSNEGQLVYKRSVGLHLQGWSGLSYHAIATRLQHEQITKTPVPVMHFAIIFNSCSLIFQIPLVMPKEVDRSIFTTTQISKKLWKSNQFCRILQPEFRSC